MKCTRQRCQVAEITFRTAAFKPSWASEITSFTPRRPRRVRLRRKSVQNGSASEAPTCMPSTSRRPSLLAPMAIMAATETMRPGLTHLEIGGIDPQIGPVALDRTVQESLHPFVDLATQTGDLTLGDAAHPHRLDQIIDRTGRDALHVGFLDDGGQCLLGGTSRLQEGWEVAAGTQLGNAQADRAGPRLPDCRSRKPFRELVRDLRARSPWLAPQRLSTSSSIRRWATKPIISRTNSSAPAFSSSSESCILSWVIGLFLSKD